MMVANGLITRQSTTGMTGAIFLFLTGFLASMAIIAGFAWLATLAPVGVLLSQLVPASQKTAWYLSRSSAIVAYLLLSGSMIWGLALSSKVVRDFVPAPLAMALHGSLSWIAVGMAAFHAAVLLFDGYYNYKIVNLFVPFTGPYRPLVVGIGILAFYGLFLVTASFAVRKWIGQRTWRTLHYLTFVLYVAVTAHGLLAGTDSSSRFIQAMYMGSVLIVLFLANYRLLTLQKKSAHRSVTV